MPVAYSTSIIARSRRPSGVETSGCAMSRVDVLEPTETSAAPATRAAAGDRRPDCASGHGRGRESDRSRARPRPLARPIAARARAARCWRTNASSAARSSASSGRLAPLGGVPRQRAQVARVAFERVRRQATLDAEVIQERVDHASPTFGRYYRLL